MFSPWTEEKKKQKQYLLDRKKMLYEIGARVNSNSNLKDRDRDGHSSDTNGNNTAGRQDYKQLHYSQSAQQLGSFETRLFDELKFERVEEVDDNNVSSTNNDHAGATDDKN